MKNSIKASVAIATFFLVPSVFLGCGDQPSKKSKGSSISTEQISGKFGDFDVPSRKDVAAQKIKADFSGSFELSEVSVFVDTNEKVQGSLPHFSGTLKHSLKRAGKFSNDDEVSIVTHKKEDGDGVQVPTSINLGTGFKFKDGQPSFSGPRLLATNVNSGHRVTWSSKKEWSHQDIVFVGDKVLEVKNRLNDNVYFYRHLNSYQNEIRIQPDVDNKRYKVWAISVNLQTLIIYRLEYVLADAEEHSDKVVDREFPQDTSDVLGEYLSINLPSSDNEELKWFSDIEFDKLSLKQVTTYYESHRGDKSAYFEVVHDIAKDTEEFELINLYDKRLQAAPAANLAMTILKDKSDSSLTTKDEVGYRVLFNSTVESSETSVQENPYSVSEMPFLVDMVNLDTAGTKDDKSMELRVLEDDAAQTVRVFGIKIYQGSLVVIEAVYAKES